MQHVWRYAGDEYANKNVVPTVKHGGGSVMVWGCMSSQGVGTLHLIYRNLSLFCKTAGAYLVLKICVNLITKKSVMGNDGIILCFAFHVLFRFIR